jgi:hypothetical protein
LGRRRDECPIFIKFTSVLEKLERLKNKRNLGSSKVRVHKDFSTEAKRIRKELVPYLKDTKKWGHKTFLRKTVLIVNGWAHDLSYLRENIQLEADSREFDNPKRSQDMTQRRTGNLEM